MPYPNASVRRLRSARVIVVPEMASMKAGVKPGNWPTRFWPEL
jgi:hypothetical protein